MHATRALIHPQHRDKMKARKAWSTYIANEFRSIPSISNKPELHRRGFLEWNLLPCRSPVVPHSGTNLCSLE